MLYILHGDDTVSLQSRLSELIENQRSATFVQGDKANASEILSALSATDLFLDTRFVVIEKVLKIDKKTLDKILPELNKASFSKSLHIILCHDSELSKAFLGKFKNTSPEMFLLPKLFFTFLDNFTPKSYKKELGILLKMENVEAEQIFYSLIKRVRQLLLAKLNIETEETTKMTPWQKDKIRTQNAKWTAEELRKIYQELFEIEVKMKSGGLMLSLKKQLDIFVTAELH